jgi:hypothetical protein
MSILFLLVPTILAVPGILLMYWLIFRWPELPGAQTRPLPVMSYEESEQKPLLTRAFLYLRDKRTSSRWYHFPT